MSRAPLGALLAILVGCAGHRAAPRGGPPPEYEPPRLLAWDAGVGPDETDPFAAAAEGEWLAAESTERAADAGADPAGSAGAGPVSLDGAGGRAIN